MTCLTLEKLNHGCATGFSCIFAFSLWIPSLLLASNQSTLENKVQTNSLLFCNLGFKACFFYLLDSIFLPIISSIISTFLCNMILKISMITNVTSRIKSRNRNIAAISLYFKCIVLACIAIIHSQKTKNFSFIVLDI